jgi:hypothetical protein
MGRAILANVPPDELESVLARVEFERFRDLLATFATDAEGSSNRVSRAILLEEPPSLDAG